MDRYQLARIHQAMRASDDFVVRLVYRDRTGTVTQRIVSPIRFLDSKTMLALCLCRESPRQFELERCSHVELVHAYDVLMPVEIRTWSPKEMASAERPRNGNAATQNTVSAMAT